MEARPHPVVPVNQLGGLAAVAARSTTDAWASGDVNGAGLLEHWNGSTWNTVAGALGSTYLSDVATAPGGVVWAVGSEYDGNTGVTKTFAGGDPLHAVLARSAKDVWAVGYGGATIGTDNTHAVVEHWNGAKWTYSSAGPSFFGSIAENPANGRLWAAGYVETTDHFNTLLKAHS